MIFASQTTWIGNQLKNNGLPSKLNRRAVLFEIGLRLAHFEIPDSYGLKVCERIYYAFGNECQRRWRGGEQGQTPFDPFR